MASLGPVAEMSPEMLSAQGNEILVKLFDVQMYVTDAGKVIIQGLLFIGSSDFKHWPGRNT